MILTVWLKAFNAPVWGATSCGCGPPWSSEGHRGSAPVFVTGPRPFSGHVHTFGEWLLSHQEKQPISHFKLLFQTALCGICIFPVFFSDCALCILLDTAGTWDLYFCLHALQNGLFFKIDIFELFYVASWQIGVPVPQSQSWARTLGNVLVAAWQDSGFVFGSTSS